MRNVFDDGTDEEEVLWQSSLKKSSHHLHLSSTNDDATECRYSMVKAGLFNDPFVEHFIPAKHLVSPKAPLINRGTFLRTASIDKIISEQLLNGPVQILSFGAGFDTRFYRFQENANLKAYVEIDFDHIVKEKSRLIAKHGLQSPILIGADLEKDFTCSVEPRLKACLDISVNTLIIMECILMYLCDDTCRNMLTALRSSFKSSKLIVFDPVFIGDRFGQVMESNLAQRGLSPQIFRKFPTIADQAERFQSLGWEIESLKSMAELGEDEGFAKVLREKSPLDEYEEWNLLTRHYYLLVAHI